MPRFPRWLSRLHKAVLQGEPYTALWALTRAHWREIVAVLGLGGFGTWFASGIEAINAFGWGVWPFAGVIFALLFSLAFWALARGLSVWPGRHREQLYMEQSTPRNDKQLIAIRGFFSYKVRPTFKLISQLLQHSWQTLPKQGPSGVALKSLAERITQHIATKYLPSVDRVTNFDDAQKFLCDYHEVYLLLRDMLHSLAKISFHDLCEDELYDQWLEHDKEYMDRIKEMAYTEYRVVSDRMFMIGESRFFGADYRRLARRRPKGGSSAAASPGSR